MKTGEPDGSRPDIGTTGGSDIGSTRPVTPAPMPRSTIVALSVATIMFVVATVSAELLWTARQDLAQRAARAADVTHAEQVATHYAVGAAIIRFERASAISPLAAQVVSVNGGIFKVEVFVNVSSTAVTYDITIDKDAGWRITDVGGVNAFLLVK
ncbi:MAG: hypothetical protein JWN03_241 [Nocardia sp.]|uniref:hypothetical protein n=1 Tax=Nocardia sp. TaxID=1821 RepID=UPI002603864B|nr:hypothetical protein [Nocardia sp.]MCU1639966.1 hypothetical protein [Nocardia sp.]